MELAIGMEMPGLLLLAAICRQEVAQLIATLHHQLLAGDKPLHRHHTAAAGASLHLHHGKGPFLDFQEHHIIDTDLDQSCIRNIHIALSPTIGIHIQAAELARACIGRKRLRREENLAGLLLGIHLLSHAPSTLHLLLGAAIQTRGADAGELGYIITVQRALNLHATQVAHGDNRRTLLTPAALGGTHIAHDAIILRTHHEGRHAVLRRNLSTHHQNPEIRLSHLKLALKLTLLSILKIKLFLQVTAGGAGSFKALQALADGINFLATAGNSSLLLPGFGHQGTHLRSNHRVKHLTLLHALGRFDTQRNATSTGQRIGFLSMARHCQIAIQTMLQSHPNSRNILNLHGGNVAGVSISRHQNRSSTATAGAVVMRAAGTMFVSMVMRAACAVFMLVLSLGGVVMRAACAVFMRVLSLGGVVMRAVLAVFMLVLRFGGMVMRAACAVFMLVLSLGGVVVRAACAVFMLMFGLGGMVVRAACAVFMLMFGLGGVVMRAASAVFMFMFGIGGVVVRAASAVFMLVLRFGGMVMRTVLAVFMCMLALGSVVMSAACAVLVFSLSSVVMSAASTVFVIVRGMVVRTTGTVLMLMFSGTMVMGASFAMLMLMAGFSRIHGRIRQSGNKA